MSTATPSDIDATRKTRTFTMPRAVSRLGVTYRQLDYWDRSGVFSPSIRAGLGNGNTRHYTETDMLILEALVAAKAVGATLNTVSELGGFLRRGVSAGDLPDVVYVGTDNKIRTESSDPAYMVVKVPAALREAGL